MLHIEKLRLTGFKSFADPVELPIEAGLTGIVGPNGCGKSNLLEAIRWIMGESSARSLRGQEMDDVIFAGVPGRPPRAFAEVALELNRPAAMGPEGSPEAAPEDGAIEVCRRIDRGRGSVYRRNGVDVRARDVQLLFVDQTSGARSAAIVTQGQVASVICQRPAERRALLAAAAGIDGWQARHEEASLRLRAAEANLERLRDVLTTLANQRQALAKQVRQAGRYRKLSARLRDAEATVIALRWQAVCAAASAAVDRAQAAEAAVAAAAEAAVGCGREQAAAAAELPGLRRAEAEAAARSQRLAAEREMLDAEAARIDKDRAGALELLRHLAADDERERQRLDEAARALDRLSREPERLAAADAHARQRIAETAAALAGRAEEIKVLEEEAERLGADLAAGEARRTMIARTLADLEDQRQRLEAKAAGLARRQAGISEMLAEDLDTAEAAAARAADTAEAAMGALEAAEALVATLAPRLATAAEEFTAADAALARLAAERDGLIALTPVEPVHPPTHPPTHPPVIDRIAVAAGYETALAAALGDDLLIPDDAAAPNRWQVLPAYDAPPPLPASAQPLADVCAAAPVLARALALIGVIDDAGGAEQPRLQPGQTLVSRSGAVWRWDGLVRAPGRTPAAAVRLQQRRRLQDLEPLLDQARRGRAEAEDRLACLRQQHAEAQRQQALCGQTARAAAAERDRAHAHAVSVRTRLADARSQAAALAESLADLEGQRQDVAARLRASRQEFEGLAGLAEDRNRLAGRRDQLRRLRAEEARQRAEHDGLIRDADARRRRAAAIASEIREWQARQEQARSQLAALDARRIAVEAEQRQREHAALELAEASRNRLEDSAAADARCRQAAAALVHGEARLNEADRAVREAERTLQRCREDRIRAEAAAESGERSRLALAAEIGERFGAEADRLIAEALAAAGDRDLPALERDIERLQRERELIGPVNLRAEDEASDLDARIAALRREEEDLLAAVAKLRRARAELDRDARERVAAAFVEIDRHFRDLFVRLFGGGRAQLVLTEPDDPLTSGLEILASPPGKRLNSLTLLSGGEQALTALALRFALFLTRATPICVLDEVDAALDDANVQRFCHLLRDLAGDGTRFLVVSHHRLTMAAMDRLFGVTMAEPGVSHLVSVDLRRADALRMAPTGAARPNLFAVRSMD